MTRFTVEQALDRLTEARRIIEAMPAQPTESEIWEGLHALADASHASDDLSAVLIRTTSAEEAVPESATTA